jgi:hypothetical protein
MSSARSITAAVNPPRAVYLDYPLGHTAGKKLDQNNQMAIMRDTLAAFSKCRDAGQIVDLDYSWHTDDAWKDSVMRPDPKASKSSHNDSRTERLGSPQYQSREDALSADPDCPSCIFLTEKSGAD